jgi:hypothetical protein
MTNEVCDAWAVCGKMPLTLFVKNPDAIKPIFCHGTAANHCWRKRVEGSEIVITYNGWRYV